MIDVTEFESLPDRELALRSVEWRRDGQVDQSFAAYFVARHATLGPFALRVALSLLAHFDDERVRMVAALYVHSDDVSVRVSSSAYFHSQKEMGLISRLPWE